MSDALFQEAITFTLSQEGGWSDNPADPGGATMRGITLSVFQAWRHDPWATVDGLRAISMAEIESIYQGLYWNPVQGASLMPGVGLAVFDAAVNLGVRRAAILLQIALGVAQDGVIGPNTLRAVAHMTASTLLARLSRERENFYRECKGFPTFGRGWIARNQACYTAACRIARLPEAIVQSSPKPTVMGVVQASADDLNADELAGLGNANPKQISSS